MAARGGLLKLLDAYIAIGGDAADFDKVVDQSEAKAKAAGGRLESAFSPRKVLGALGTAAGAVFGSMMVGANQLDAATHQLEADTNLTAEAAGKAEHAMAGIYRNNLQGFAEIGASMAIVINGLDLTGTAADDMTAKFMKFQTATGQGSSAVSAFHEILNAWNLDATAAPGIMDKLVASHQKYGSIVTENQSALLAIAPAMQAMNMTIDDGIGLLNLFDVAGINASKAPMALQRAITTLKPGQNINDLIAQISSIVDPTERAQAAMKIFGARGGVQMAQAFQPGITSVNEFKTSVEETTGATTEAAAAIESSFGNQFKLILKNAGGWLADFGTQFGPLLMVASAFGPGLTRAIGAGLGGLAGLLIPRVTAAVAETGIPAAIAGSGVGQLVGKAISAGASAAIKAAPIIFIAVAAKVAWDYVGDQSNNVDLLNATSAGAAQAGLEELKKRRDLVKTALDAEKARFDPIEDFFGLSQQNNLQKQFDALDSMVTAAGGQVGTDATTAIATGVAQAAPKVEVAAADVIKTFGISMQGVLNASKQTGADGMLAMAQGIASARAKPLDAFTSLTEMLKHQMSRGAEAARLAGELTSKELAAGLKSKDPEVVAQAIAVKESILSRLADLQFTGGIGKKAMDQLNAGMKSKNPETRRISTEAVVAVMAELGKVVPQGGAAGKAAMAQLDAGILSKIPEVSAAALAAKNAAVAQMNAAAGPAGAAGAAAGAAFAAAIRAKTASALAAVLANITANAAKYTDAAMHDSRPPGQAAGGAYPAGQVNWVGERGPELRVSALPGYTLTHQEAVTIASGAQGAGRSGATVNLTVNNPKPEPASTSTKRELQKLAAFGVLA